MSFALILGTPDRIVAASDSRGRRGTSYVDTVRKIDVDEHGSVFAATGLGDLALQAWQQTAHRPTTRQRTDDMMQRIRGASVDGDGDLLFGVFRHDAAAHIVKLRFVNGRVGVSQGVPVTTWPYAVGFGWDDAGPLKTERLNQVIAVLHQRPSESGMEELARETLNIAAAQSIKVGGTTHVVIVDRHGIRWQSN